MTTSEYWMGINIHLPIDQSEKVFEFLKTLGFKDTDWCVMERKQDFSQVHWGPTPVLASRWLAAEYPEWENNE